MEGRKEKRPEVASERQPREPYRARRLRQRLAREREVVERRELVSVLPRQVLGEGALAVGTEAGAKEPLCHGRVGAVEADARKASLERTRHRLLHPGAMARSEEARAELPWSPRRGSICGATGLLRSSGMTR